MLGRVILSVCLTCFLQASASSNQRATSDQAKATPELTILFFTASWCEPCHAVAPILEKFAAKNRHCVELKAFDFDHAKAEAARWGVKQIPVVIVLSSEGKVVLRYEGATKQSLETLDSALQDLVMRLRKGR